MTTIVHLFTVRAAYVPPAWRMFIPPLLQAGVIGLGIVAGSVVLQLSGAVCLLALAILYGVPDRDDVLTIDEARTRLDAIEREGVWQ